MWRNLIRTHEDSATMQSHQRLIIPVATAIVFILAGLSLAWDFRGTMAAAPSTSVAHAPTVEQVSSEILETAKGLGITQQQAVDPTASRSRSARRAKDRNQKAFRADHYVDRET
jgi:hypothetical protein